VAPVADRLVVVALNPQGTVNRCLVHLPAPTIPNGLGYDTPFMPGQFAPSRWRSVCGVEGLVYNHAGAFEGVPVCPACRERT